MRVMTMGRKDETRTPRSRVKNAIRQLWLRSRERAYAIKLAGRSCSKCHKKASVAKGREVKLEVHHTFGIDWDGLVDLIIDRVLQRPEDYTVLCKGCHKAHHDEEKEHPFG